MNFLNLTIGEFLGLAGVLSAGIVALYLLDRSKRRRVVATLRFWTASDVRTEWKRSRRIQQPWSLLLQLVSILLLLLAIAGPRIGGDLNSTRDHVLILDTSAWMGARARQGILLDQAKSLALDYLKTVPVDDRVMLVRADALPTPVTAFDTRRDVIATAIQQSQPSASALNLEQALEFAQRSQRLQSQRLGEIVFAGAGRISRQDSDSIQTPSNLRVLQVPSAGENVGLRKLGLRRAPTAVPGAYESWEAFVGLRNDGTRPREVALTLNFGGSTVATKTMTIAAGAESESTYTFNRPRAPFLEARIASTNGRGDAFPQDDHAVIDVPEEKNLRVTVYSDQPELLQPLLAGNPRIEASFAAPSKYDASAKADILILDRFAPAQPPATNAIWIDPPPNAPFKFRAPGTNVKLSWRPESPLATGLFSKDVELASTKVFNTENGDDVVAEVPGGPIVIARTASAASGGWKTAALGFHPIRTSMRFELATPLLMANILRWMGPEAFRRLEVQAGTVGSINVALDQGVNPATIKVTGDNQKALPFTVEGNSLRFFAGAPGEVRVTTGNRETVYSLTLPDVADLAWKPEATVARGIPAPSRRVSAANLWPWLAILGAIGLFVDWLLYGRSLLFRLRARGAGSGIAGKIPWRKAS